MTLEEAQAKIAELTEQAEAKDKTIAELNENAGKDKLSEAEVKKMEKRFFNQGYDSAKNKFEDEKKNLISKEELNSELEKRERNFKIQKELLKMGIKAPEKAMKIIEEEDLEKFGSEDFKVDEFKKRYEDVIVFKSEEKPNGNSNNFTKNNGEPKKAKLTAEQYAEMSKEERMKVPKEEREALA